MGRNENSEGDSHTTESAFVELFSSSASLSKKAIGSPTLRPSISIGSEVSMALEDDSSPIRLLYFQFKTGTSGLRNIQYLESFKLMANRIFIIV